MLMMLAFRGPNGKKLRADADDARATVGKENMLSCFSGSLFQQTKYPADARDAVVPTIGVILLSPSSTKSIPADAHDARCCRAFRGSACSRC